MESPITSRHWNDANGNPAGGSTYGHGFAISWQNGPLNEPGGGRTWGAFVEDVIAAAIDRIEHYESSKFACAENDEALRALRLALRWLNVRTERRAKAGVEGTHKGN